MEWLLSVFGVRVGGAILDVQTDAKLMLRGGKASETTAKHEDSGPKPGRGPPETIPQKPTCSIRVRRFLAKFVIVCPKVCVPRLRESGPAGPGHRHRE